MENQNAKALTVKQWANDEKPRERMLSQGKKQLSNTELVAILLRSGVRGKNVVEVSREVLQFAGGSLCTLSRMDYSELRKIKGLGAAKATTLMAALELGWRMHSEMAMETAAQLTSSEALFNYLVADLEGLDHEEFWAVYLNQNYRPLGRQRIASGGITETTVDLRMLFRGAIECRATKLAVAHNHPGGSLQPSRADRMLTKRICDAGKILGINLVDHIIVAASAGSKTGYFSFNDEGLLDLN